MDAPDVDTLMQAVAALPPEELRRFHERFEDHVAELWRRRFAEMEARQTSASPGLDLTAASH